MGWLHSWIHNTQNDKLWMTSKGKTIPTCKHNTASPPVLPKWEAILHSITIRCCHCYRVVYYLMESNRGISMCWFYNHTCWGLIVNIRSFISKCSWLFDLSPKWMRQKNIDKSITVNRSQIFFFQITSSALHVFYRKLEIPKFDMLWQCRFYTIS